jgi:hypothetical protein
MALRMGLEKFSVSRTIRWLLRVERGQQDDEFDVKLVPLSNAILFDVTIQI